MKIHKIGILCILLGVVMVVSAMTLFIKNRIDNKKAGESAKNIMLSIQDSVTLNNSSLPVPTVGTFNLNQQSTEMSTMVIDGYEYIGYLTIPVIDLELPVMSDWDYGRLRIAPCRQFGSTKSNDLVIAAHNFEEHFGKIHNLEYGDLMFFTDVDGKTRFFTVSKIETLQPTQVEEMKSGDWDITLYTCTYSGRSRVTIRFKEIDSESVKKIMESAQ